MPQGLTLEQMIKAMSATPPVAEPKETLKSKQRRAHHKNGTFRADDLATTEQNEAWQEN